MEKYQFLISVLLKSKNWKNVDATSFGHMNISCVQIYLILVSSFKFIYDFLQIQYNWLVAVFPPLYWLLQMFVFIMIIDIIGLCYI